MIKALMVMTMMLADGSTQTMTHNDVWELERCQAAREAMRKEALATFKDDPDVKDIRVDCKPR